MSGGVPLDEDALALFAHKGAGLDVHVPQAGRDNAVKVRRIVELTRAIAGPLSGLRILDLACGEGVYAIEAALHGASVVAVDARTDRMDQGAAIAHRHGLDRVRFEQRDVRTISAATHGTFDVVWVLGILYHLDTPEVFELLGRLRGLCTRMIVIDTLVAAHAEVSVSWEGHGYAGQYHREHGEDDPPELRRSRLLKSIDNARSFRFERDSLVRALADAGFAAVLEAAAPLEPGKASDRITLVAMPGERLTIHTYPWLAGLSEEEIAARVSPSAPSPVAR